MVVLANTSFKTSCHMNKMKNLRVVPFPKWHSTQCRNNFPHLSFVKDSSKILSYFILIPFLVDRSGSWHHSVLPSWNLCGLIHVGNLQSTTHIVLWFILGSCTWKDCQVQGHHTSQLLHCIYCWSSSRSLQHSFTHGIVGIQEINHCGRRIRYFSALIRYQSFVNPHISIPKASVFQNSRKEYVFICHFSR